MVIAGRRVGGSAGLAVTYLLACGEMKTAELGALCWSKEEIYLTMFLFSASGVGGGGGGFGGGLGSTAINFFF